MSIRVLIVKTSSMGDVIHSLPALSDAATTLGARFDWVVEEGFSDIPTWHPAVDHVIPIALRRWRKSLSAKQTREEIRIFFKQLKLERYDAVVDLQGLLKSAWIGCFAQSKKRCGYAFKFAREPMASLFYNRRAQVSKELHAVKRNRLLLAQSLGYANEPIVQLQGDYSIKSYFLNLKKANDAKQDIDLGENESLVNIKNISSKMKLAHNHPIITQHKKNIIFFHGTSREDKYWPEEDWQALAQQCVENGYQVLLPWGSEQELARAQRISKINEHCLLLEKMSLTQIAELLIHVEQVVSVDTGLGHLAAALDCRNISLYGPTSIDLIGCYGNNQTHIVADDGDMKSISVPQVWHAITQAKPKD